MDKITKLFGILHAIYLDTRVGGANESHSFDDVFFFISASIILYLVPLDSLWYLEMNDTNKDGVT